MKAIKLHPLFAAGAIVLALAACRPGTAEFSESEAPKSLVLDNATASIEMHFAPGSNRLVPADAARLRALAAAGSIAPSDRVDVAANGSPALAAARFRKIAAELLRYRVVANKHPIAGVPPNRAIIEIGRYLVTLPHCPDWSKSAPLGYANTHASNYGCATAVNLGMMVASPTDLAEGRPVGTVDAIPAAAAVQRYQSDKVQLPAAATLGPIGASGSGATGSGATGAGTAGSVP